MLRKWLRSWLGIDVTDSFIRDVMAREQETANRLNTIDQAIAANEAARVQDMTEIQQRLDMPAKKKASGRPFAVLAKVAELGAQAQRMKDAG